MKTVHCNQVNPGLKTIAFFTGNKITSIEKISGKLTCKLNGKRMTTGDARREILSNNIIIDASGNKVV